MLCKTKSAYCTMAAASSSVLSDSENSFDSFGDSDVDESESRVRSALPVSTSLFDRDSDDISVSDFDLDSDNESFDGDSSSSSDEDVTLPPARRGRGRGVRANRGRGRGQTRAGRGQPRPGPGGDTDECQWSFDLVDRPGIRYVNAANVGMTDSDERRGLSPLGLFSLFFTDYLMREIAVETNRYADQVMARPPRHGAAHLPWSPVTLPELRTWLGLLFTMGVVKKIGRLAEYWSVHVATLTPVFCQTMPCKRFMQILRFLHFVNNEDETLDKTVKTWKVQKLMDYVCKRYRDNYTPRRELSVDETMLKFKGRLGIKQYIKIKPVKWGIKLFTLAESATGYVLNVLPYTGKRDDTVFSKTTQTVLDVSSLYLHLGHHLFLDNYYMSIELVKALFSKATLCCGTVNANRVGLPADIKKTCARVKKLKRGESLKRVRGGILAITWMDTRGSLTCFAIFLTVLAMLTFVDVIRRRVPKLLSVALRQSNYTILTWEVSTSLTSESALIGVTSNPSLGIFRYSFISCNYLPFKPFSFAKNCMQMT